ncbi:MAG: NifU family protein [Pseudomonadota bacterium]
MYIITEDTPNPDVKKFIPGRDVMGSDGTYEFKTAEDAKVSVMASRLMDIADVTYVFYGSDFISVTKSNNVAWEDVRLDIIDVITEHYLTGQALFIDSDFSEDIEFDEADKETVELIIQLIETRIRPAVAQDGGDITLKKYEGGIVYVSLKGACSGCPSSTITLKSGIENMLKHYIPDVTEVLAIE